MVIRWSRMPSAAWRPTSTEHLKFEARLNAKYPPHLAQTAKRKPAKSTLLAPQVLIHDQTDSKPYLNWIVAALITLPSFNCSSTVKKPATEPIVEVVSQLKINCGLLKRKVLFPFAPVVGE